MDRAGSPEPRDITLRQATVAVRRAGNVGAISLVAFGVLFVLSCEVPDLRAESPWAEDPYDLVVSVTALVAPFVGALTFVRVQRWAASDSMPADAIRMVGRGVATVLVLIGASVIACLWSIVAGSDGEAGPATPWLIGCAIGVGVTVSYASVRLAQAIQVGRRIPRVQELMPEADAFDDLLAFLTRPRALLGNRARAVSRSLDLAADVLRAFVESPRWSPRRHTIGFPVMVAVAFGVGFSAWHSLAEGAAGPLGGLMVGTLYGIIAAVIVLASYALLGRFLRIVRST